MVREAPQSLTKAEWKVMRIVWELRSCAARDVCARAEQRHGWAVSTVKTHLRRLVDKGYLSVTRVGNSFLYRPARTALPTLIGEADSLLEHMTEGTAAPLLAHMVKKVKLSSDELADLRDLLDAHDDDEEATS